MGIKDDVKGKVKEVKGKVREQWGQATNDPKQVIKGNIEQGLGKAQQAVSDLKDKASKTFNDTVAKVKNPENGTYDREVPGVVDPMASNKRNI